MKLSVYKKQSCTKSKSNIGFASDTFYRLDVLHTFGTILVLVIMHTIEHGPLKISFSSLVT